MMCLYIQKGWIVPLFCYLHLFVHIYLDLSRTSLSLTFISHLLLAFHCILYQAADRRQHAENSRFGFACFNFGFSRYSIAKAPPPDVFMYVHLLRSKDSENNKFQFRYKFRTLGNPKKQRKHFSVLRPPPASCIYMSYNYFVELVFVLIIN